MNNHRSWIEMPRVDVACYEQVTKTARGRTYPKRKQVPMWNREHVIRQFQALDGSTRSEAGALLDAYERNFREVFASPPPKRDRRR